jgi:hypothetical protein
MTFFFEGNEGWFSICSNLKVNLSNRLRRQESSDDSSNDQPQNQRCRLHSDSLAVQRPVSDIDNQRY